MIIHILTSYSIVMNLFTYIAATCAYAASLNNVT